MPPSPKGSRRLAGERADPPRGRAPSSGWRLTDGEPNRAPTGLTARRLHDPPGAGGEMPMIRKCMAVLPLAGAALIAAGCGGSNGSSGSQPASTAKSVAGQPAPAGGAMPSVDTGATLAVPQPRPGAVVSANSVPFDVRL